MTEIVTYTSHNIHKTQNINSTNYQGLLQRKFYSEKHVLETYSEYKILDFLYTEPTNSQLIVNYYATFHVSTLLCHPQDARSYYLSKLLNTLNAELKPICHLLALLGAHHILHVSGVRVKYLNKVFDKTI
jgi:hypothetical protein